MWRLMAILLLMAAPAMALTGPRLRLTSSRQMSVPVVVSLGNLSAQAVNNASLTGLEQAVLLGTVSARSSSTASVSGVAQTINLGSPSVVDFTGFEAAAWNGWSNAGSPTFGLVAYAHSGSYAVGANLGNGQTASLTKTASTGTNGSIQIYYSCIQASISLSVDGCAAGKCATVSNGAPGWQQLSVTGLSAGSHAFTISITSTFNGGNSVYVDDITIQ